MVATFVLLYIDDNLMVGSWDYLKPAWAASIESLFDILGYPKEYLYKSTLSINKYYNSLYSYKRK